MELNYHSCNSANKCFNLENEGFERLIKSLPEDEKKDLFFDMETVSKTEAVDLSNRINKNDPIINKNTYDPRRIFVVALKALKMGLISLNQVATLHIVDAAVRDFMTHSSTFASYRYVEEGKIFLKIKGNPVSQDITPNEFISLNYLKPIIPIGYSLACLPERFFNLNTEEWLQFCKKMKKVASSEQQLHLFTVPEIGCSSLLINQIQKVLKMCHFIDIPEKSNRPDGYSEVVFIKKMVVPSFSMFQAALKVKAKTLGRKAVKLIPTYYLLEKQDYAETKEKVGIPFALYFPERSIWQRYSLSNPRFKAIIDGYFHEGPYAALLHDFYHALRELVMTENMTKARYYLAKIATNHKHNKKDANSKEISDILVDGELIFCYAPEKNTMFEVNGSKNPQIFGDLFNEQTIKERLHPELKKTFLFDMVEKKGFWKKEFNLGRWDLEEAERKLYDEYSLHIVEDYIKYGIYADSSKPWELLEAAEAGKGELEKLLNEGIDIDIEEDNADRALYYAILKNNKEAVKLLLEHKSSPNKRFISDDTPLNLASEKGYEDVVTLLLESRAHPSFRNHKTCISSLGIAARYGHETIVKKLLEYGAVVDTKNMRGMTALHFAAFAGEYQIVKLLLQQKEISINEINKNGVTPLFLACQGGFVGVAELLIAHGASLDIKNHQGLKPIDIAEFEGHTDIVELLNKMMEFTKGQELSTKETISI